MIGPETPRNQSQSKKFKNIAIRRYIEFNTARRGPPQSYLDLFRTRSTRVSRAQSRAPTPRALTRATSPVTSVANMPQAEAPAKPRAKEKGSYLFKYLKHVAISEGGGGTITFRRDRENEKGLLNGDTRKGFAKTQAVKGPSYAELLNRSLERMNESPGDKRQARKKRKKKRKITKKPREAGGQSEKNAERTKTPLLKVVGGEEGDQAREDDRIEPKAEAEGAQEAQKKEEGEEDKGSNEPARRDDADDEWRSFLCRLNLRKMLRDRVREFKYEINERVQAQSDEKSS